MASPSCIRKLGYGSIDEIINKPISETFYISPEKRKELVRIIDEKGSIEDSEVQLKRKDGSPLWVTSSSHHYRDENGMIAGIEGIFHDISERKRAEEALQESHDRFEATIASLDDAIFLVDPATRLIIECNDAATRIFGYSYEELVGSETTSLHVDRAHVEQFGREAKATYEVPGYYTREFEMRRKDGCVFPTEHFVRPIHDPDGRILYVVSLVRDITERKLADKALRESEDRYRKLVEISPDSVILHQEGKIIYLNPAAVTLIGATSPDEIIGKNVLDYIQTDFREAVKTNIQKDLEGVSTSLMELPMVRPDGTRVIVEGRGIRTVSNGKPAVQVTLKDVTASRQAERVLQESELLFREVFNHANDAVFLLERTPHGPGNYLLVNDKAVRMLGYSKEELLELSPRDIVPEETQKKIMPVVIKKLLKDGHATFESSHRRKDGSIYPVEVSTHTFRYKEKDVDLSIVRDITERKRAEELARESEVRFRTVFENAGDAIAVHDPEGNFVEVNDVICRRLGYSREELLTMKVVDVDDPVHARNVEGRIRELTKNGHIVFETVHNTRDGRQITEEVSAVLIHLGNKPYVMSIARDITERKELEKEMEHHAQELRKFSTSLAAANKKFTLLSSVTRHDINNQLTMLRGYLAILEDSKPAPSQEEYFQKASAAAQRISAMIHFTKEYEQIGVSSPAWQDLCTLVETAAKQTQLGKINVKNELTGGIEVFADPLIIKVFYNLMDNAVRYGGKITTIRFSVEESGDDQIIVCEDDGVGVVIEEKAKVFDREFGKNTGLGLFLSREILDITGITITETGEPGKGARFEMVVPDGAWRIAEAVKKQD
jgi:PAS domain S-box-containing protein